MTGIAMEQVWSAAVSLAAVICSHLAPMHWR